MVLGVILQHVDNRLPNVPQASGDSDFDHIEGAWRKAGRGALFFRAGLHLGILYTHT